MSFQVIQQRPGYFHDPHFYITLAGQGMAPTDRWYSVIAAESFLPADAARKLRDVGFVVMPGPTIPGA